MRIGKWTAALSALVLGVSLGGSRARADLMLTVTSGAGPSITIDSTTGTATLTGEAASTTYTFQVNGTATTFTTNGAGTAAGVAITANATTIDFVANGGTATTTFDSYAVKDINIAQVTGPANSTFTDITTQVSNLSSGTSSTLTINPSTTFASPSGAITVTSALSSSSLQSGTVSFYSTVNGVNVPVTAPLVPLSLSAPGFTSATATVLAGASPVPVSNTLVISGLGAGLTDSITATTTLAAPEPATLAMVFSVLPVFGLAAWRRGREKSA